MIKNFAKRFLSAFLAVLLVASAAPKEVEAQQAAPTGYSGQGVPLTAEELQQLTGPIALYPDALVAQILGASTFPDQVAAASQWLEQNKSLTGTALTNAVDGQRGHARGRTNRPLTADDVDADAEVGLRAGP